MLYFDRIHIFEEIDVNKTIKSKESDICHSLYFLNKAFNFQNHMYAIDVMIY